MCSVLLCKYSCYPWFYFLQIKNNNPGTGKRAKGNTRSKWTVVVSPKGEEKITQAVTVAAVRIFTMQFIIRYLFFPCGQLHGGGGGYTDLTER